MNTTKRLLISAIVAMDQNRVIGISNTLPWHLPADLKHFKQITTGHPIVMGRKTFDSIGKPLPNRQNLVVTKNPAWHVDGCVRVETLKEACDFAMSIDAHELFIIGGESIFREYLPNVSRLYLTIIQHQFVGDTYFPKIDESKWRVISAEDHVADQTNQYDYRFLVLER